MSMYNLLEYNLNYSIKNIDTTDSLWFYLNTEADGANGILKSTTIFVQLKYLGNFSISLEMSLINCKAGLKFEWINHCVFTAYGNDNTIIMMLI